MPCKAFLGSAGVTTPDAKTNAKCNDKVKLGYFNDNAIGHVNDKVKIRYFNDKVN